MSPQPCECRRRSCVGTQRYTEMVVCCPLAISESTAWARQLQHALACCQCAVVQVLVTTTCGTTPRQRSLTATPILMAFTVTRRLQNAWALANCITHQPCLAMHSHSYPNAQAQTTPAQPALPRVRQATSKTTTVNQPAIYTKQTRAPPHAHTSDSHSHGLLATPLRPLRRHAALAPSLC